MLCLARYNSHLLSPLSVGAPTAFEIDAALFDNLDQIKYVLPLAVLGGDSSTLCAPSRAKSLGQWTVLKLNIIIILPPYEMGFVLTLLSPLNLIIFLAQAISSMKPTHMTEQCCILR